MSHIPNWRFYQGLRNEWRWYKLHETGVVIAGCDRAFAELSGCMANAEHAGFDKNGTFQVHTRNSDEHLRSASLDGYPPATAKSDAAQIA
jgi:hypothetical protein